MKKFFHPKIVILLCIITCVFITTNIHWGRNKWQNIIEADARGYYAYLPAVFIYQDLNFAFYDSVEKVRYNTPFNYDYRVGANGRTINKYFCGTAIAQAPFFLVAHSLSFFTGAATDGYSRIYMLSITLAALFYLFLGLTFTDKLLKTYNIKEGYRSFTLIALLFSTNLFFYSVCEMGMSHVYSFAFIAMFSYYIRAFFLTGKGKFILIALMILGMIFLIRPSNLMIILIIPFLAGDVYSILKSIRNLKRDLSPFIKGIVLMLLIMSVQPLIYKISTGNLWVDSYPGEQFNFSDPHIWDILFSYKKGLFLYTPFYLLCLAGLYFIYKRSKFETISFIVFFFSITYVLSCWWSWWYGGSFSSRAYVEYLPLFGILFAVMCQDSAKRFFRFAILTLFLIITFLCQFQTYQYRYLIIHWEDMTKERYWDVFLKMNKEEIKKY